MDALIQGTISALGYLEDGVYYQEPDCFETIRDLIRFLRTDDKVMLARKICGELNIIENDLIPIIKSPNLKDDMFDITLRLLANLTQPAIVSLQGRQPEDRDEWQTYWILEDNLRRAKHAFADVKFFSILKYHLEKYFLNTDWESRLEENRLVMERIVVLLRYIFSISPTERDGRRTAAESNSHDRLIIAFLDSGIDKILTNIGTQSKEHEFHLSIMVIFALILKEHKPADIICAGRARTEAEKQKAEEELRQVVEAEKAKLAAQKRKILASRHSRFSGSYIVKGVSAVNKERDLVVVKPIKDVSELSFLEERKTKKITARNRRPFEAEQKTHLSSMDVRIKLKLFIEDDLMKCFNRLMKSTKQLAFDTRLSAGQKNADLYYFLLMRFMLEYTRLAGLSSSNVSMCIPVEAFHHIQVHLDNYLESATAQKKEAKSYGLRAQYALSAYKELILFHQHLIDKGTPEEKEFAKRTCFHILTVEEYREMGFALIRKYKPGFLSKTFLRELVLATHYYFRLLERSVKAGQLTTVTKKTRIRRTGARNKKVVDDSAGLTPLPAVVDSMTADEMDEVWPKIVGEVRDIVLGNVEPSDDQIPINSLLDVQDEQHQSFAMLKIQRSLRERRPADAMGMYRASRAIWPTEGIFGDPNKSVDEQVEEIREIFFADLKEVADELLKAETVAHKKFTVETMFDEGGEEDEYSDEEEEPDRYETKELSLFRIFAQVRTQIGGMTKEEMKKHPLFELYNFGYHLLKQFFKCFERLEEKLAPEILFWKGPKECYEIQNGYGTYDEAKHSKHGNEYTWSEELEDELRSLYNEYRDMDERPEGMDVLDFIEPNLSRPRTRKQILKKLKEFALDPLGAKANKGQKRYQWTDGLKTELAALKLQYDEMDQEDHELMVLYNHTLSVDIVDYVMRRLSEKKPRRQVERELEALGAVIKRREKPRFVST
ncbi:unnamed protein product [Heligmosomoides polygyrus]|uniref:TIMELESS domain-containing protein n=1 Tax=Heligmosomoides polygyrus TaxID=6339 RepID=A0A3P7ZQH1_HELPZ|nr:unnamed protein product [Heligmosomoides polygyrus]